MKILVSGSSGLVGQALLPALKREGHQVAILVRESKSQARAGETSIFWEPASGKIDSNSLRIWGVPDCFIHLAGKNIGSGRWTEQQKRELRESRVDATRLLSENLVANGLVPKTYIAASATGIYGDRGDELLNEQSLPGNDFLAQLSKDWEAAAAPLQRAASRMIWLRIGMILSAEGGALSKMLPAFKMGVAGKLGSGKQWISWIHIEDLIRVILFVLKQSEITGVLNSVAPNPVQNVEFTKALGAALHRPTLFPAPGALLKVAFGQVASDVLLASQRTIPKRLESLGFTWQFPTIQLALTNLFEKKRA